MHAAILVQDRGLDLSVPVEVAPSPELPIQPVGPPFVGRTAELAWLQAAWTRATNGQGGVAFLAAGGRSMGKTRLAAELARQIHDRGRWVLYGRCMPEGTDPLQPFTQALVGWGGADRDGLGGQRSPAAFGKGLAGVLAGRSDARRGCCVLDDLHVAEAPALEALAALVGAAATRRLLVLGTYCQEKASPELAALVQRLDPGAGGRRRLGPFDQPMRWPGSWASTRASRRRRRPPEPC